MVNVRSVMFGWGLSSFAAEFINCFKSDSEPTNLKYIWRKSKGTVMDRIGVGIPSMDQRNSLLSLLVSGETAFDICPDMCHGSPKNM